MLAPVKIDNSPTFAERLLIMNVLEQEIIVFAADREVWRRWLEENFETQKEVWLLFPWKSLGKESVSYNDAVEEALCFGWIDSVVKKYDEGHRKWKFTPRRKGSGYSQPNIERLRHMRAQGKIHSSLREKLDPVIDAEFVFPQDIIEILKCEEEVWRNYCSFSETYRRLRIAHIECVRGYPEHFEKRLKYFIEKTRKGQIIKGTGGAGHLY